MAENSRGHNYRTNNGCWNCRHCYIDCSHPDALAYYCQIPLANMFPNDAPERRVDLLGSCDRLEVDKSRVKISSLQWIKEHAELLGSRGWARMNGRPEPDSDYDYCFFTDDNEHLWEYRQLLLDVVKEEKGWKTRELADGYLLISSDMIDVSVHPVIKREELLIAYKLRDAGITKEQMCLLLDEMASLRAKRRRIWG